MTPFFAIAAISLLAAASVALVVTLVLWRPVSALVYKRADALLRGTTAAHADRAETPAQQVVLAFLARFFLLGMARDWGVSSKPPVLLLYGLTTGIIAWVLFFYFAGLPQTVCLAIAVAAFWAAPHLLARLEQSNADKRFMALFPDSIDMTVRMLRAGMPVNKAIRLVAEKEAAPINGVFASIADQIDIGIPLDDALSKASEQVDLPDFRFFAAAVALQHTTGGNLVSTLEILADIVRRRAAVRMKARAATAEVRTSAYVLTALPFCMFAALEFINPNYLAVLVTDPRGNIILGATALLLVLAFLSMRYLMRRVTHL